jgi:hypothetical protein
MFQQQIQMQMAAMEKRAETSDLSYLLARRTLDLDILIRGKQQRFKRE